MPHTIVLAVGRDPVLLETRRLILQAAGYTVRSVLSLKQAMFQLLTGDFDLVILCHSISAEDRRRLTSSIREHTARIPIISISTGFGLPDPFTNATIDSDPKQLVTGLREILSRSDERFDGENDHVA
jgi:CheY-like chemotaxis protein